MRKIFFFLVSTFCLFNQIVIPFALAETQTAKKSKDQRDTNSTESEPVIHLTVTATRIQTPTEDLPASVSVVTEKEIENRNIQHLDTALNTESGVFVRRTRGLMDTMNRIALRGFPNQARTLIMLDGQPLNDAYSSNYNLSGVPPELLNRIEVVKGPFSSLYGGYAMGGAVNFITRMPTKREINLKTGYGSSFDREDAADDLRRFFISYGDRIGNTSILFGYNRQDTSGYPNNLNVQSLKPPANIKGWKPTTDTKGAPRYIIGDRGDTRWFNDSFFIKTEHKFSSDTKAGLTYIRNRREMNYEKPTSYLKDEKGNTIYTYKSGRATVYESSFLAQNNGDTQNIINANFETKIIDFGVKLIAGFQNREVNYYTTPSVMRAKITGGPGKISDTPNETYYADLQFNRLFFDNHIITFGATYRTGEIDGREFDMSNWKWDHVRGKKTYITQGKDKVYSLFLQDEYTMSDKIILYLGFRNDWWETYDGFVNQIGAKGYPIKYSPRDASEFSPKATIVYKPFDGTKLSASAGKAFRPPNLYELYRTWTATSGITYAGNPSLKPETTTSWEVGLEQKLWKGATFKATYFEDYVKDMIYTKVTSPTYRDKVNAGKADKYGVEVEMEQWIGDDLKLFGNFTYNYGKIKENKAAPQSEDKLLTDIPIKMFNVGMEYKRKKISASIVARYVGDQFNNDDNSDVVNNVYTSYDPYFVVDAKVTYSFSDNLKISLSADNIFDRDYFAYFKAPGASWFAEISFRY